RDLVTPFDHNVHHRGHGTVAAYGSLKPPPTGRFRGVHPHLSHSMTLSCVFLTQSPQCPSDSTSRWTSCPPENHRLVAPGSPWLVSGFRFRARLDVTIPSTFPGPRGITPAFKYSAPHSSARGTSTLLSNALLTAHHGCWTRTHLGLDKQCPFPRPVSSI